MYTGIGLQEVGSATDKDWQDPAAAMGAPGAPEPPEPGGGEFTGQDDEGGPSDAGTFPEPVSEGDDAGMDTDWGSTYFGFKTDDDMEGSQMIDELSVDLGEVKSDAQLLELYEELASRFEAKDGPPAGSRSRTSWTSGCAITAHGSPPSPTGWRPTSTRRSG